MRSANNQAIEFLNVFPQEDLRSFGDIMDLTIFDIGTAADVKPAQPTKEEQQMMAGVEAELLARFDKAVNKRKEAETKAAIEAIVEEMEQMEEVVILKEEIVVLPQEARSEFTDAELLWLSNIPAEIAANHKPDTAPARPRSWRKGQWIQKVASIFSVSFNN